MKFKDFVSWVMEQLPYEEYEELEDSKGDFVLAIDVPSAGTKYDIIETIRNVPPLSKNLRYNSKEEVVRMIFDRVKYPAEPFFYHPGVEVYPMNGVIRFYFKSLGYDLQIENGEQSFVALDRMKLYLDAMS